MARGSNVRGSIVIVGVIGDWGEWGAVVERKRGVSWLTLLFITNNFLSSLNTYSSHRLKLFESSTALCDAHQAVHIANTNQPNIAISHFCALQRAVWFRALHVWWSIWLPAFASLFTVMHYCCILGTSVNCVHTGMHWFLICCTGDDIFSWESQVGMSFALLPFGIYQ